MNVKGNLIDQIKKEEADRDLSTRIFTVALTANEINAILAVTSDMTSVWRIAGCAPKEIDLASLLSGCDKLTRPVEEDYQKRCASRIGDLR